MSAIDIDREDEAGARRFIVPGVLVLALLGVGWFIYSQMGQSGGGPKRQTVKIAVLPDAPPPPPPPPKEEKRPEPKPEDNKPEPQEQKPIEAPPEPQQLKMEGAAGDGPSAFGAGSVNNEYRGGAIGAGGGTVGDRLAASSYGNAVKRDIDNWLQRQAALRRAGDYSLPILIWVRADGSVERVRLVGSSGDEGTDQTLREALDRFPGFRNPPPAGMPQPISLKLSNRRAG